MTKEEALKIALAYIKMGELDHNDMLVITAMEEALAQPNSEYERGFVDGMQKQMKSSVDKAVNKMAQPEQKPVALDQFHEHMAWPFYKAPPQRTWVGLTDAEVFDVWLNETPAPARVFYPKLCRSVEAKLKKKNT